MTNPESTRNKGNTARSSFMNTSKTSLLSPELRRKIEAVGFLKMIEDRQKKMNKEENFSNDKVPHPNLDRRSFNASRGSMSVIGNTSTANHLFDFDKDKESLREDILEFKKVRNDDTKEIQRLRCLIHRHGFIDPEDPK